MGLWAFLVNPQFACLFVCAKKGRRWSPTCSSRPWRQLGMLCFVWQTTASFFSFGTKIDKVSVGCLFYRFWWPLIVGSVWSGGGSVVHQAEGREKERERERERASSDGLACGCRVQTDQFPVHHQFSKPNILHNFHRFLTPDHLQLLQNHHNVFIILQLLLNDLMLQLVMGMALWNRTNMVIGKPLKQNPE